MLPLTGQAGTTVPGALSGTAADSQAAVSGHDQAATAVASGGLDGTLLLIIVGLLSIPLLLVMAVIATVLTRR